MSARLFISVVLLLLTGVCYAQWTAEDSLRLRKSLEKGEELNLNKEAVKRIKFDNSAENPRMSNEKPWMRFDKSLPRVIAPSAVVESDSLYDSRRLSNRTLPFMMLETYKSTYIPLPLDTLVTSMGMILPPPDGISLGNGVRVDGGLFFGLDLLQVFTKDFWQFRKKRMRTRTISVLNDYSKHK